MPNIDTTIIVPALNESEIIAKTLGDIAAYVREHPALGAVEMVVVAAGSDNTANIARAFADKFAAMRVVTPARAKGKGNDVRLGFKAAHGDVQLFMDADLSTPLDYIETAVARIRGGDDIVIGSRDLRKIHASAKRALLSVASNWLVRILFLPRIGDSQCGFKAFRGDVARALFLPKLQITGWAFDIEILTQAKRAGYRIAQLPIPDWHETRKDDLRSEGLRRAALRTLKDVFALRFSMWGKSLDAHVGTLIALAAVLHGGLAWLIGNRQSIWFDEAYSINLIQHPVQQVIRLTAVDVHPPLYYLVLKVWAATFGTSDVALRSLSILCGAGAVVIGLLLVKRLWGRRAVVCCAPFVVAAPFLVRYTFEIRMYAMASLIGISATYILVAAIQANRRSTRWLLWATYGMLVAIGMYTLYYMALVWIVHLIWYLYQARASRPRMPWKTLWRQPLLWADIGAAALFGAWVPSFLEQLHQVQQWFWIGPVTYNTFINVWSLIFSYLSNGQLTSWTSIAFIAAAIIAIYFVSRALSLSSGAQRQYIVLLVLYSVVPMLILYAASLPPLQPVFTARYDSHVVIGTYLLLGVAVYFVLSRRRTVLACLAALALLLVLAQGTVNLYHYGNNQTDYRPAAYYLRDHAAANEALVTFGPQDYMIFHHYLPSRHIYFYSDSPLSTSGGYAILHGSPWQVTHAASFTGQPVWFVYTGAEPQYLPAFHVRDGGVTVGRFHLYRYKPYVGTTPVIDHVKHASHAPIISPLSA